MSVRKDEKRRTWSVTFYYTEWNGERVRHRKTGFKTKKEAQEYERDFLQNHSGTPKMSFSALCDLYLDDLRGRVKKSTYSNRKIFIDTCCIPILGNMQIGDITPAVVRRWQSQMIDRGYAPGTLREHHTSLSSIFNFAERYYSLSANPARLCGTMGKTSRGNMAIWSPKQVAAVEHEMENEIARTMLDLMFWTGIRVGEALALTPADINGNMLSITKTARIVDGERHISTPKTPRSRRDIIMPNSVGNLINSYISRLPDAAPETPLFEISRAGFRLLLNRAAERAGVPRIRVHDLRHSHASLLIEMGCNPVLIAERLGHENAQTTLQIYSHLYPNKHNEVATNLDKLRTFGQISGNGNVDAQNF